MKSLPLVGTSSDTGLSFDDVLRYSRSLFAVRGAGSERFEKLTCVLISLFHGARAFSRL